jgi:hypothetical protein
MSRSFIYLRRALFATSCAIVFGFGATTAFADVSLPPSGSGSCQLGYAYISWDCPECPEEGGLCDGRSTRCICY